MLFKSSSITLKKSRHLSPTKWGIYCTRIKAIALIVCSFFALSLVIKSVTKTDLEIGKQGFTTFKNIPALTNFSLIVAPAMKIDIKNPKQRMIEALDTYKNSEVFADKTAPKSFNPRHRHRMTDKNELFLLFKQTYESLLFVALFLSFVLPVVALKRSIGILQTGYYMWHGKTARGRENKRILNLIYYFILLPSILWYGFISPLRNLPKIHGSPGRFSYMIGVTRMAFGLIFVSLIIYIGIQVYHTENAIIKWAGIAGMLCFLPPAYMSFSWAKKAFKSYKAKSDVAKVLMRLLLMFSPFFNKNTLEIYWGQVYQYRKNNNIAVDFDSKVKRFIKGIFGKDTDEGKADVDLIVHHKSSNNYMVVEIKSYEAWRQPDVVRQAIDNAKRVEDATLSLSIPVIICPLSMGIEIFAIAYMKNGDGIVFDDKNYNDFRKIDITRVQCIILNPWHLTGNMCSLIMILGFRDQYNNSNTIDR
jgi:hypothetical protein